MVGVDILTGLKQSNPEVVCAGIRQSERLKDKPPTIHKELRDVKVRVEERTGRGWCVFADQDIKSCREIVDYG